MPANNRIRRSISTTVQGMQHWNEITIKSKIQIFSKKTYRSNDKFKNLTE